MHRPANSTRAAPSLARHGRPAGRRGPFAPGARALPARGTDGWFKQREMVISWNFMVVSWDLKGFTGLMGYTGEIDGFHRDSNLDFTLEPNEKDDLTTKTVVS